MTVIC